MKLLNLFNNDTIESWLKEFSLNENGMLPVIDAENIKKEEIAEKLKQALLENDKVVTIGDNHLFSIELIKEFSKKYANPAVVIFDAHPDCLSKEDIVPTISNFIKKEKIILVGNRNWRPAEYDFIRENKIRVFDAKKISELGSQEVIETVMENVRGADALYISVDLDVLDPSFAPGINCHEPGGLSTREMVFFIQKLKLLKNLKAIDLMDYDIDDNRTAKVVAKLITELY